MIAFCKFINNRGDDEFIFRILFKNAFAIPKIAFVFCKRFELLIVNLNGLARNKSVFNFGSVSANILNWSCTHISRNQRHVFQSAKILTNCPKYKFVPVFASHTFYPNKILVLFYDFFSF